MSARPSWWRRLLARPLEYVTLSRAMAAAQGLSTEQRTARTRAAQEAWQKRDAAEVLASRGSHAEAIGLAVEAAKLVKECLVVAAGSSTVETRRARRAAEDLDWACAKLTPLPTLDAHVTRSQKRALRTLLAAELALRNPVGEALLDRRGLLRLRWQRAIVALAIVLSPLMALVFVRRSFLGLTARAGSVLDDQYTADRVLDGDPDTEWVANGEEWLEIRFRSRKVHTVRILNGDTLPDRAVKDMHVDFYDHAE
ncbi:MAG: discoidin domain-containing protein, partial [Acidimicrobiales bacterium]